MGFFDTLRELGDIAKDIVTLPFEIGKAAAELGQDIQEAVVQDVTHKIARTPEKPIRTSYTIRDEATALIQKSQDEYWAAMEKYALQWKRMISKSEKLLQSRTDTYAQIEHHVRSKRLAKLPSSSIPALDPPAVPSIDTVQFDFGTYTGMVSMRMEAAKEYLAKAKEYRLEVKAQIVEINQLKRLIMRVSAAQKEELEMLSAIRKACQRKSEAKLIQSADLLREIAALCLGEVSEQTNENYLILLKKLEKL